VTYMAVTVAYLLVCAGLGLARGRGRSDISVRVIAALAAAMVCAQLALLLTR
jgi:hypothetical protein